MRPHGQPHDDFVQRAQKNAARNLTAFLWVVSRRLVSCVFTTWKLTGFDQFAVSLASFVLFFFRLFQSFFDLVFVFFILLAKSLGQSDAVVVAFFLVFD